MPDLIEYIRIQWTDIHHSRNQEWRILAIIGAAFAALFVTEVELSVQIAIAIFGLVVSIIGVYISIAHWIIFYSKIQVIRECEKKLGIEAEFRRGPIPVQGVVVLVFFLLASALSGWLAWLLSSNLLISSIASGIVFVVGLWLCTISNSPLRKCIEHSEQKPLTLIKGSESRERKDDRESELLKFPLVAELDDLVECLALMGQKALKLIANELRETESKWDKPKWFFTSSEGKVNDRKLLLNPRDDFQFSIANEHSKQDFHVHHTVFEIYTSYSKIGITYLGDGGEKVVQLAKGALIIPPGVPHKAQLTGPTFVFQYAIREGKVHDDKEIVG